MSDVEIKAFVPSLPTPVEICQQIERIDSSKEFELPDRGRRFLHFVVNETLAGRSQFIKAFTIAQEIFGRDISFDAQNDPVVRIEASRIRRALERYYLIAGRDDRIIVTIPKGGYVPRFEYASATPTAGVSAAADEQIHTDPRRPRLPSTAALAIRAGLALAGALLFVFFLHKYQSSYSYPPAISSDGAYEALLVVNAFESDASQTNASALARGLRDEVIAELAKFTEVVVIVDPSKAIDLDAKGYTLQASVQLDGDQFRSLVRLTRRSDATVIWANTYDEDLRTKSKLEIQADIADRIAAAIAQPFGAIFQADTETIAEGSAQAGGVYACTLAYYSYRRSMDISDHNIALDCLMKATERFPNSATSWALLSLTYLDELRFHEKLGATAARDPLEFATDAAERAVAIAPNNARALHALMLVRFFSGDIEKALQIGAAAYSANADDTEVAGEYGLRLAMSGRWQSGCELVSDAVKKNVGPQGYYEVGMALCAQMGGDLQAAESWSRMSDLEYNPMHRVVLASILGAEGKTIEASRERDWLYVNAPHLMANIRREVLRRLQRREDQERFFNGLREAGVAADPVVPR